jgi:pyruvate/2-oxoglutarate dehydrogenase complex dihydrolipoamide dehydrogenase (E3) component
VIRHAVLKQPIDARKAVIPAVTFTDPELAQAGMTEAEARRQGYNSLRILRWPHYDNDRALAEGETHGHIKVVADRAGRILGVTITGAQAGELLAPWTLSIAQGLTIGALAGLAAPYPTLGDAGRRAALSFFAPGLTRSRLRRILGWLRIFG